MCSNEDPTQAKKKKSLTSEILTHTHTHIHIVYGMFLKTVLLPVFLDMENMGSLIRLNDQYNALFSSLVLFPFF